MATYLLMARGLGDASAAMQLARLCRAIAQVQSLAEQLDSEASLGRYGTKVFLHRVVVVFFSME